MSMGERLREARNKIGYSQEEVARRIDLDRTTIGKYEMMHVYHLQLLLQD